MDFVEILSKAGPGAALLISVYWGQQLWKKLDERQAEIDRVNESRLAEKALVVEALVKSSLALANASEAVRLKGG